MWWGGGRRRRSSARGGRGGSATAHPPPPLHSRACAINTVSVKKINQMQAGKTNSERSNDLGERNTMRRSVPKSTNTNAPASTGDTIQLVGRGWMGRGRGLVGVR